LETEIPEVPKKEDMLKKPHKKELNGSLDEIEDEIKKLRKARKEYIRNL
jgi:hypothetical protein